MGRLKRLFCRVPKYWFVLCTCLVMLYLALVYRKYKIEHTLDQDDVDYFAQNINVTYLLIANGIHIQNIAAYEAEISLTNTGVKVLPGHGWEIFFSQAYPYSEGYEKVEYGVRLFHWNGQLYSFRPTKGFGTLAPNMTKTIRVYTSYWNLAVTDTYPNWYIVFTGFKPRVLSSTEGDPFKFARRVNSPTSWRMSREEMVDPVSPEDRFAEQVDNLNQPTLPVIPTPLMTLTYNPSNEVSVRLMVVVTEAAMMREATLLAKAWGLKIVDMAPANKYIKFELGNVDLDDHNAVQEEAYSLVVNTKRRHVIIRSPAAVGAFYAVQTLFSLLHQEEMLPEIVIKDAPRFSYRGIMLDIARNFHGMDSIKRYLDLMATYKLNKFHLHLSDDEGWRLEIPGLKELTEVGGRRCHDPKETQCILPFLGAPLEQVAPGSGYLTVDDYKELLHYATERHIEIIPEIDFPGHSHAAIKSMEARFLKNYDTNQEEAKKYLLSDLKDQSIYYSVQRFKDNVVNPCALSTYTFIDKVVSTIHMLHEDISPLRMLHVGGDEIPDSAWSASPLCDLLHLSGNIRKTLKELFFMKLSDILASYNLDLALWQDGLSLGSGHLMQKSKFHRDVYAYVWNDVHEPQQARHLISKGYKVILTRATNLYFDHPYELDPLEPGLNWAKRQVTLQDVYLFVPEHAIADSSEINCGPTKPCSDLKLSDFQGIQGTVFGELLRSQDIVDYMLLPRALALAERAWKEAPLKNITSSLSRKEALKGQWTDFLNTIRHRELARLDKMGFKYRVPPPGARVVDGFLRISTEFPGLMVEMSKTGSPPWVIVMSGQLQVQSGDYIFLRARWVEQNMLSVLEDSKWQKFERLTLV